MIGFMIGVFVGATVGCIAMALCVAAKMGEYNDK